MQTLPHVSLLCKSLSLLLELAQTVHGASPVFTLDVSIQRELCRRPQLIRFTALMPKGSNCYSTLTTSVLTMSHPRSVQALFPQRQACATQNISGIFVICSTFLEVLFISDIPLFQVFNLPYTQAFQSKVRSGRSHSSVTLLCF